MKKDISYLVSWGRNKQNAWSGTFYSLYRALETYYDVRDIDTSISRWVNAFLQRVLRMDETAVKKIHRQRLRKRLAGVQGTVFQFNDILADNGQRKTFMFTDNVMSFVNHLRATDERTFSVCGFQKADKALIGRRAAEQDDYLRHHCSGIFTMGHWLRNYLVEQGFPQDLVHAVGGGCNIDKSLIKPGKKTGDKILFIGKDFKRKGGYITYEAFKRLREKGRKVNLYVIGPTADPISSPVEGYHFVGQLPFSEEAKYFNACDVFCMPSYFEAYGLVFVEALSFGVPCIGRNCYEMPYFIEEGKTGLLLHHDDAAELATLMELALDDKEMARNVEEKKDFYLKEYSWDTVAEKIARVIG